MTASPSRYSTIQIGLHWLIVLMVIIQLVVADSMTELFDALEEGEPATASDVFGGTVHYWLGLSILAVMLARLFLRLTRGVPAHAPAPAPDVATTPAWQSRAASIVHWALYAVLIAAPLSGLVAWYRLADNGEIHGLVRPILILLVAIHVGAALYNQFIRKDGTLTRMLRPH